MMTPALTEQFTGRPACSLTSFTARLDKLAEVAVKAGLGLAHGQELLITAPLEAVPLVRRVTEHAYKAGAALVTTFYVAAGCHRRCVSVGRCSAWYHWGQSCAACQAGSGKGGPRQSRAFQGQPRCA